MITFKQFISEATKRTKEEEQSYARGHALFTPLKVAGWSMPAMPHAASQAKDRYPDATNQQWVWFLTKIAEALNKYTKRWAGDAQQPFKSKSLGLFVTMNVNFDRMEFRPITALENSMKPMPGDKKLLRTEARADSQIICMELIELE